MKRNLALTLLLLAVTTVASFATITVSSPTSGATTTSPVKITATVSGFTRAVQGWAVYVDSKAVSWNPTTSLSTSATMATGTHTIMLKVWDTADVSQTTSFSVTVGTASTSTSATGSVTISSPASGATVSSPVSVVASASTSTSTVPITGMVVYVDSVSSYTTSSASVNTSLAMAAGSHTILVKAWNSQGSTFSKSVSITVPSTTTTSTLKLTTSSLSSGTVGTAYSAALAASGGSSPYTYSVSSGTLPTGLSLSSSGVISGTLTTAATSSFTVTVKDSASTQQSASATYSLVVNAASSGSGSSTGSSSLSSAYAAYIAANYGSAKGYSSSNTYYVSASGSDSNSGSSSSPWKTLSKADSAAPACSLILVGDGTWSATNRVVQLSSSGTSSCHKVFAAQNYGGAKFVSTSNASNGADIFLTAGNYADVLGMDISGKGCTGLMGEGQYSNLMYNRVHDVAPVASGQSSGWCGNGTGGGGIQFPGSSSSMGKGSVVSNNVIWNIGYSGDEWVHGIYIVASYHTLQNNVIYGVSGGCIQAYHWPTNNVITNNTLVNCKWGYIVGAESSSLPAANTTFNNNVMHGNSSFDIEECGASYCGVAMGSGNTYSNNITASSSSSTHLEGGTISNNKTSSPSFVSEASPASGGNFAPASGSPMLNSGTATKASTADILGASRGSSPSIGAYQK